VCDPWPIDSPLGNGIDKADLQSPPTGARGKHGRTRRGVEEQRVNMIQSTPSNERRHRLCKVNVIVNAKLDSTLTSQTAFE